MSVVECEICPLRCQLNESMPIGICKAIGLINGEISFLNDGVFEYGVHYIEELGFYHFYPGSKAMYLVFPGCNLRCLFCENWKIVMKSIVEIKGFTGTMSPRDLVNLSLSKRVDGLVLSCNSALNGKYISELAKLIKSEELYLALITNGVLNEPYLINLVRSIDGFMIRFFGYSDESYSRISIYPNSYSMAIKFLERVIDFNKHAEASYTLITGINDSTEELSNFFESIKSIDDNIPVHLRRFKPRYIMYDRAPTRNKALVDAFKLAREIGIKYVYIDDFFEATEKNTYCPRDGTQLIKRIGAWIKHSLDPGYKCPKCDKEVPITGKIKDTLDQDLLKFKA